MSATDDLLVMDKGRLKEVKSIFKIFKIMFNHFGTVKINIQNRRGLGS